MKEIYPIDTAYFESLENEYDVRCFDNDGELLPASRILYNVLSEKKIWDKMKKKERKGLIQHLYFTNEDILDIVEAFLIEKKENKRLHDDKIKVLDACLEVVNNYNEFQNTYPYSKSIYKLVFEELGIEKFINKIR